MSQTTAMPSSTPETTCANTPPGKDAFIPLAWAGWRMRIPEHWRLLKVDGSWRRGFMAVGDPQTAQFQLKWWRPRRRIQGDQWIDRRVRSMRMPDTAVIRNAAGNREHFSETAWIPRARGSRKLSRAVWYGYAPRANMVLEIVLNPIAPAGDRRYFRRRVLPTLAVSPDGEPTWWSAFDATFRVPAGFRAIEHKLHLGNPMIRFHNPRGEQLLLRQLYPAELALGRREIAFWLRHWPFKEFRRYSASAPIEPFALTLPSGRASGVLRRGRKRYRFPFHGIKPHETFTAALEDRSRDRLLIVEYDARPPLDEQVARSILRHMNTTL